MKLLVKDLIKLPEKKTITNKHTIKWGLGFNSAREIIANLEVTDEALEKVGYIRKDKIVLDEGRTDRIKKLTQVIRNCAECDLDYGTLKTLKMIDDEAHAIVTSKDIIKRGEVDVERTEILMGNIVKQGLERDRGTGEIVKDQVLAIALAFEEGRLLR